MDVATFADRVLELWLDEKFSYENHQALGRMIFRHEAVRKRAELIAAGATDPILRHSREALLNVLRPTFEADEAADRAYRDKHGLPPRD
jgi:hypothetical protein